jgi:hypothetical protein
MFTRLPTSSAILGIGNRGVSTLTKTIVLGWLRKEEVVTSFGTEKVSLNVVFQLEPYPFRLCVSFYRSFFLWFALLFFSHFYICKALASFGHCFFLCHDIHYNLSATMFIIKFRLFEVI